VAETIERPNHNRHCVSQTAKAICTRCEFTHDGTLAVAYAEKHYATSGHRIKVTIEETFIMDGD
jgi:hypothetical protein